MSSTHTLYVDGIALWANGLCGWTASAPVLRGEETYTAAAAPRPSAEILAPAERRRAPDSVALALHVAQSACAMAQRDPATLSSVFASADGDAAITDYMCATLAATPTQLSPTKFHNSVHNAAAGYWTIGTGCHQATTALSALRDSFSMGLIEAAAQVTCDRRSVLLVAYDIEARGPLATLPGSSRGLFGAALVLSPAHGPCSVARLDLNLAPGPAPAAADLSDALSALALSNRSGNCLPLFVALAKSGARKLALPAGPQQHLEIEVSACQP